MKVNDFVNTTPPAEDNLEDFDLQAQRLVEMGFPLQLISDYTEKMKTDEKFRAKMLNKGRYFEHMINTGEIDMKKFNKTMESKMGTKTGDTENGEV